MSNRALAALALVLAAQGCRAAPDAATAPTAGASASTAARPTLGLMSTLPIFWSEAGNVAEVVQGKTAAGWVRPALEEHFALEPLDALDAVAMARIDRLMLAQPRVLSAAENVALDDWVRKGGELLLFADPMLTGHSRFAIGDRRRPQDVALLSPILAHWGLELTFDETQGEGERSIDASGVAVPVNLAGVLQLRSGEACAVVAGGVIAECRIGKGKVTIVADAAVLEDPDDGPVNGRRDALAHLLALAFT